MGMITKTMILSAYNYGIKVHKGNMSKSEGKEYINSETGMDAGSANDYITVLLAMIEGKEYHRTINALATETFLENIGNDFGVDVQKKAALATKMHTDYYQH